MLRLHYGNVYVSITGGSQRERAVVRHALTTRDPETHELYCVFRNDRFPAGLAERVVDALRDADVKFKTRGRPVLEDASTIRVPKNLLNGASLYPEYQVPAVVLSLYRKRGVVWLPTGSGKTIVSAAIVKLLAKRGINSMMVVPGVNSMHQTWRRWRGYGVGTVGRLGDSVAELGRDHLVTVVDSLARRIESGDRKLQRFLDQCGCVIFMEAQHLPASMWQSVANKLDMPYRLALSATPFQDEDQQAGIRDTLLIGATGETIIDIPDSLVMNLGRMATPMIHFISSGGPNLGAERNWHRIKRDGLIENHYRNQSAVRCASRLAKKGLKVIVLTTEVKHGRMLAAAISKAGVKHTYMFQGQSKFSHFAGGFLRHTERKPIYDVADWLEELPRYVLVGSPAVDEDADFPDADVLINCSGGRAMGRLIQRVGRVLRAKPEKGNVAHVVDFDDGCGYVLRRHSQKRREIYANRYDGADRFKILDHVSPDSVVEAVMGNRAKA